jgi:ubiquinone/menaquinone biosynthesis C-methylase UbiE
MSSIIESKAVQTTKKKQKEKKAPLPPLHGPWPQRKKKKRGKKRGAQSNNLERASHSAPSSASADLQQCSDPAQFESQFVHRVYNNIASHFSSTRARPWPCITTFLQGLELGSSVLDCGCGNGKYLRQETRRLNMAGFDMSENLLQVCVDQGFSVCSANALCLPFKTSCYDALISIAVLHHLSTPERRTEALAEMVRVVRPGGQICLYVWSFEEGGRRKGKAPPSQEAYIPWNMPTRYNKKHKANDGEVKTRTVGSAVLPTASTEGAQGGLNDTGQELLYSRFYHLFTKPELLELCASVPGIKVLQCDMDHQNWYAIMEKL